jgi:single-strand DNA-binding protein|nr:MAG TPA: Single strand binding protein [Caudoviricetes sp.]
MNLLVHMGRLTQEPEVRYSTDGKAVAKLSLAINRKYKQEGQADADFFNYVAFGKTAEFIGKYFHKGMKALITGELRNNHYEKDGVKHYSEQVIINTIEFAESKQTNPAATVNQGFMNIPDNVEDEGLPFN